MKMHDLLPQNIQNFVNFREVNFFLILNIFNFFFLYFYNNNFSIFCNKQVSPIAKLPRIFTKFVHRLKSRLTTKLTVDIIIINAFLQNY